MPSVSSGDESKRVQQMVRRRPSLLRSIAFELLGLLLFVAIFNFLLPDLGSNLPDAGLIFLGILFSTVPALLWLIFFYRADAREPEPKRLVALVFLASMLLMAALYEPVINRLFQVESWLYRSWWSHLLGGILIIGVFEMGLVYLAVRYLVYDHPEFDERLDGIIYAVAAGLGLATVINFGYVINRGGVDLGIGSIRMVTNTLGYASFAGVLGYFIGQVKFEKAPIYYLPAGLLISGVLTGFYFYAIDLAGSGGLAPAPWRDLMLGAFLSVMTLAAVGWLVGRSNEETLRVAGPYAAMDAEQRAAAEAEAAAVAAAAPPPIASAAGTATDETPVAGTPSETEGA